MLGLEEKFRQFVLRRIRPLTDETLKDYEGLAALESELIQDWEILQYETGYEVERYGQPPRARGKKKILLSSKPAKAYYARQKSGEQGRLVRLIKLADRRADILMAPYEKEYSALHDLWIARRRLALTSGNFFQISWRPTKLWRFLSAWGKYRTTQIKTGFILLPTWLKDFFNRKRVPEEVKQQKPRPDKKY
jgi:hypothetical protein